MGSAVSAVTNAISPSSSSLSNPLNALSTTSSLNLGSLGNIGNLGNIGGEIEGAISQLGSNPFISQLTQNPVGAVTGLGTSQISGLVNSLVPAVPVADQSQLQSQINTASGLSSQNQANAQSMQNAANGQFGTTQNAIGQSQNAINNAAAVNTGANSNVNNAIGLTAQTAAGGGAAQQAAKAQLQAGTDSAIKSQEAMANSGNLSQMISGQKTAMDNAAQLQQSNALNAATTQADLATNAQNTYNSAAAQQASTANSNAVLQQQQAAQQASLYNNQLGAATNYAGQANTADSNAITGQTNALGIQQQALGQTSQYRAQALGGLMNSGGGIAATALSSDENLKTNIQPTNQIEDFSDMGNKNSSNNWQILQSDKKEKKKIDKNDKISAFLDAIDPVSFEYKESDGQMGRTPGEHLGVIAQQVQQAPGGESMIVETPKGKGIDLASAVGTLLAAAAHNHNRLEDLEDLLKSKISKGKK